jgi:hypothetical protein
VSESALRQIWRQWRSSERTATPDRALDVMDTTVRALKAHRVPDWERGWELSTALSRLGFLLSFYDDRLDDARAALEQARDPGPADGWVTGWNLANVAARTGQFALAGTLLDEVEVQAANAAAADLIFFVPGRTAVSCVVGFEAATAPALFALQRTLVAYLAQQASLPELETMIRSCDAAGDVGSAVATWVADSIIAVLPGFGEA